MEETTNVTTSGEVEATSQTVETDSTTTENEVVTSNEVENNGTAETDDSTETNGENEAKEPINWEKSYKELQSFSTKQSQRLAELEKQIADSKPKYVDEKGKITPEYEQQYRFNVDNREFLTYDNLSRQLNADERVEVERLLNEAKSLYNPNNKTAYNQKMSEIKDYFRADIVEQIALDKKNLENQMQSEFNRLQNEHRQQRANEVAEEVFKMPDVRELTDQSSENYSPEVVGILKQMFDLTGGIDLDMTQKAISSIKSLGVKEYLAKQSVDKQKQTASVPSDSGITTTNTTKLTRDYAVSHYREACKKYGMDEVDKIIMKGQ